MGHLEHIGVARRSGRYPWGSGGDNISYIEKLSSQGLTEKEIADSLGISTTELRNQKTLEKAKIKEEQRLFVTRQKDSGMSISAISDETGLAESTVRDLLRPSANAKYRVITMIVDVLKRAVERFKYIDVGEGVELWLGVSDTKLKNALTMLKNEGYTVHYLREDQMGTDKQTSHMILAAPGVSFEEVRANRDKIELPVETSFDRGHTYTGVQPINNISPNRLSVSYESNRDGLIEIRPGIDDLSLNGSRYAQVRIGVEGGKYIKGMAVYNNDLPEGVDILFHTKKTDTGNNLDVLKDQDLSGSNPFGASIKPQHITTNSNGEKIVSALNVVNEESDWSDWSNTLASQFLSKQPVKLAKQQLDIDYENVKSDLDDILSISEPTLRDYLLNDFAETADAKAEQLKAAALPRQTTAVLIPSNTMKPTEVYAPNYNNGDVVSLVRYPHGGIFEIPTLVVNNKNRELRKTIGSDSSDAIGINPEVAKRLSGADFDGDFVLVIPNHTGQIKTSKPLEQLKGFDPILSYPKYEGMKVMSESLKELEMGKISNLITDMTLMGANDSEIARAVKHSMVVIDAAKHELNYRQSYIDNGIAALKKTYRGSAQKGASTVISRASSEQRVDARKDYFTIDPTTGEKIHIPSGETYKTVKDGVEVSIRKQTKSTQMRETSDASTLSSGTAMESVYVNYANNMKSLANKARLSTLSSEKGVRNPSATKTYKEQVDSLDAKLRLAMKHQPLERKAQLVASQIYSSKLKANKNMTPAQKKKEKGRALVAARVRLGVKKPRIEITNKEWVAIEMGAISPTKLKRILRNADENDIRTLAIPKTPLGISSAKVLRAKSLLNAGYTNAEVALSIGVSVNQLQRLKSEGGL